MSQVASFTRNHGCETDCTSHPAHFQEIAIPSRLSMEQVNICSCVASRSAAADLVAEWPGVVDLNRKQYEDVMSKKVFNSNRI